MKLDFSQLMINLMMLYGLVLSRKTLVFEYYCKKLYSILLLIQALVFNEFSIKMTLKEHHLESNGLDDFIAYFRYFLKCFSPDSFIKSQLIFDLVIKVLMNLSNYQNTFDGFFIKQLLLLDLQVSTKINFLNLSFKSINSIRLKS